MSARTSREVRCTSTTPPRPAPPGRGEIARAALLALFFLAAPTAGDIGGCGQEAQDLDARKFFAAKQQLDCTRCLECGLATKTCDRACDPGLARTSFDAGCFPLVHDGEVCLNALEAAGCDEYESYVADQGASAPTECNFCPAASRPTSVVDDQVKLEVSDK